MADLDAMDGEAGLEAEEVVQGYDCQFFTAPPKQFQTECPICLLVLRNPSQAGCCGNVFCTACLDKALKDTRNNCPICKQSNPPVFRDLHLKRKLSEFQVYCTYRGRAGQGGVDDVGCAWRGELGTLDKHLNAEPTPDNQTLGCLFVEIPCLYCNKRFQRCRIKNHQELICPKRVETCPYCPFTSTYEDIHEDHLSKCPSYPVRCPHCNTGLCRCDLGPHITADCLLAPVVCEFELVGCKQRLTKIEMEAHARDHCLIHAQMLMDHTAVYDDNELTHLFRSSVQSLCQESTELSSVNVELTTHIMAARSEMSTLKTVQLIMILAVATLLLIISKLIHVLYIEK